MDHVILHVTYTCHPGMAEKFVTSIKQAGLQAAVQAEEGCLQYDYHLSCEAPDTVVLLEMWRDSDCWLTHTTQPHMQRIREVKAKLVKHTDVQRFL